MPPVTVYWSDGVQGDGFVPPGMTIEQARKIPGTGPQVGPANARQSNYYNLIFCGTKGYLGTNGRGESVGLLPGARWAEYKLPNAYLPRSPGASTGDNHSAHPLSMAAATLRWMSFTAGPSRSRRQRSCSRGDHDQRRKRRNDLTAHPEDTGVLDLQQCLRRPSAV